MFQSQRVDTVKHLSTHFSRCHKREELVINYFCGTCGVYLDPAKRQSSSKIPQLTPILKVYRHEQGRAAHRPTHPSLQHHAEQPLAASDHADWDSADDFGSPPFHPRPVSRHSDTPSLSPPPQHTPPGMTFQVEETINEIPSHKPRPHWVPDHLPQGEGNHNAPRRMMRMVWMDSSMTRNNRPHLQTKLPFCSSESSGKQHSLKTPPGRNSQTVAPILPLLLENWLPI